jgi:hypothetical protein
MSTIHDGSEPICVAEIAGVEYWLRGEIEPQVAAEAISDQVRPKVIIIGGLSNQLGLSTLAQCIQDKGVLHALLIGEDTVDLSKALLEVGFSHFTAIDSSDAIRLVETLYHLTEPGDAALVFGRSFGVDDAEVIAAVKSLEERISAA